MNTEELRKYALELATRHLANEPHNLGTALYWANEFYKWLSTDQAETAHTVDPETPYSKDMVSKTELKEMLPSLGGKFKLNKFPSAAEIVGYKQAIDDVLRLIDEL